MSLIFASPADRLLALHLTADDHRVGILVSVDVIAFARAAGEDPSVVAKSLPSKFHETPAIGGRWFGFVSDPSQLDQLLRLLGPEDMPRPVGPKH